MHTSTEILQFYALAITLGTIHYPKLEGYWAQYWPSNTVIFSCVMSRDCFGLILKFLHINDKKGQKQKSETGYDPLYKICPLVTSLISKFQASYNP